MTNLLDNPNNESSSDKNEIRIKYDSNKFYKAMLHKFYTMGILTETEHGTVLGTIGSQRGSSQE